MSLAFRIALTSALLLATIPTGTRAESLSPPVEPRIVNGVLTSDYPSVGALLRGWHWAGGRALWIDEAALALNLRARDFAGLLRPLDGGTASASIGGAYASARQRP